MERGCRNCMWLYHMVTYNPTAPCSDCLDYDKWQTAKPVTNADRIRAMSDEELADYMSGYCCSYRSYDTRCKRFVGCNDCWLDWLKEEVEDGK